MMLVRKNKYFSNVFSNIYQRYSSVMPSKDEVYESSSESTPISCDRSGLLNHHRNMLHNKVPYREPSSWIHLTEKYQRKIYGRYGWKSGVSPRLCFTAKSSNVKDHYKILLEPDSIQTMINKDKTQKQEKIDAILKREEEIAQKLEKLEQWKKELSQRLHKKEADAIAAKEKKDRLIEEVRRYFGYKIDPKDDRFKEVLQQKEKEEKKKQKEAKKKAKEQKLMAKLTGGSGSEVV